MFQQQVGCQGARMCTRAACRTGSRPVLLPGWEGLLRCRHLQAFSVLSQEESPQGRDLAVHSTLQRSQMQRLLHWRGLLHGRRLLA